LFITDLVAANNSLLASSIVSCSHSTTWQHCSYQQA